MYSVNYVLYGATTANPGKGVPTVNINGTWGTVCGAGFRMEEANAACRGLDYRYALSHTNVNSDDSYDCRESCER